MLADVIDVNDIGMIERGGRPRFLHETPLALGVAGFCSREHLDCNEATEASGAGPVHEAHASLADDGDNLVEPELAVRRERHGRRLPVGSVYRDIPPGAAKTRYVTRSAMDLAWTKSNGRMHRLAVGKL